MTSLTLDGRTAIVTGGSRGIGAAIAGALASAGTRVVAASLHGAAPAGLPADRVFPVQVDVSDEESVDALFRAGIAKLGRLDIVVNAAGILTLAPIVEASASDWRRTLEVNLTGSFLCSRAALRHLLAQEADEHGLRGAIVQIVSGSGVHGWPGAGAYTASKFGVMGLSEAMRDEVRGQGVRVIDVLPGMVSTGMTDDPRFALRPKLDPSDVAHAVVAALTASPAAMITRIDVRHQHVPPG